MKKVIVGLAGAVGLVVAFTLLSAVAVAAPHLVGSDFRISNVGTDGDPARSASRPAVAFDPATDTYLVVWAADGLATDDEFEIFGQRLSADGTELGGDFRISNVGTDGDVGRTGLEPDVAFDSTTGEYLVTWVGDGLATDDEFEIFGQRLSAAGTRLGSNFRISNVGTDGDVGRAASEPAVAFDSTTNEYLVTWRGDGLATDNELEVFGQRLSATGTELGGDFRISNVGTDGDAQRAGAEPAVAFDSTTNEYLVTWRGDGLATDNELEVFGQRLSATGTELGGDFRISNVGTDGDAERDGFGPAVAFDSTTGEYLVTWVGDGLATDQEFEIFGQRLSATGAELGGDFRISNVGTDGDARRGGFEPAVAFDPTSNEYLVTWSGDGLATANEFEIFGQSLSATRAELGGDFRISTVGTDGDALRGGFEPAVAFDSTTGGYLVTWSGDGLATDNEFEIFGHRLVSSDATTTALTCTPGSLEVGGSSTCVATVTDTGAVAKAPSGQVKFASDSPGAFSGAGSCVLAIAGTDRSSCRVTYSPFAVGAGSGTHHLSAAYGGDETHLESLGVSQVTVVQATVLTAPGTKILTKPHKTTTSRKALFTFVADQPGSSFQCSLDKRPFRPCRSPLKVKKLKKGSHVFRVKAISPQGIADPTPAVFRWKVK